MSEIDKLIPKGIPNGNDLVREGTKIGQTVDLGVTAFLREKNVKTDAEYKESCARAGKITWNSIMGLSSVKEQVEALKYLYNYSKENGIVIDRCIVIANMRMALPPEHWNKVPRGTSFMLETPEDYIAIAQAAPIQPCFEDFHIGSPASVRNTINALRAGCGYMGTLSQYSWDYPYWQDDVAQVIEVVKAIGIVAAKKKQRIMVDSYMDDGIPTQFLDQISVVGYARLEKYVVEELCGANYSTGYGGLTGDVAIKVATWLALQDILRADHNVISFLYGNTIDVTKSDLDLNYVITATEMIPFAIIERAQRTGVSLLPIPATEKLRVPTREEIAQVHTVTQRAVQLRFNDYQKMINLSKIRKIRELLVTEGNKFYENIKAKLKEMGVNIFDPLQVLLAVRRLGAANLEEMCHPGEKNPRLARRIKPYLPTAVFKISTEEKELTLKKVYSEQLGDCVRDKCIVVASTDAHEFGLLVLSEVLKDLGARIVEGGVSQDPEEVLDLAATMNTPYIALSTHNGLCLDYSKRMAELSRQRGQQVKVYMGGVLNGILEGQTEPVDVSNRLKDYGVIPCSEILHLVKEIANNEWSESLKMDNLV